VDSRTRRGLLCSSHSHRCCGAGSGGLLHVFWFAIIVVAGVVEAAVGLCGCALSSPHPSHWRVGERSL
jgi:hypothetical protein